MVSTMVDSIMVITDRMVYMVATTVNMEEINAFVEKHSKTTTNIFLS